MDGPTTRPIGEAAFTVRRGMPVEIRGRKVPTITVNGQLRVMFENRAAWVAFADIIAEWLERDYREEPDARLSVERVVK
jgi:hypothetical protein